MKALVRSVVLSVMLMAPAIAADMRMPVKAPAPPPASVHTWSGIYIGAHGGGGWDSTCYLYDTGSHGCHDGDGWLGGGQIGFNVQQGQFVFGVEFSGSWADITGSHSAQSLVTISFSSDVSTILTLTGRVGVTLDRALLYATGGGAWLRQTIDYQAVSAYSDKLNRTGWTIGAGLEYALTPNWSIAAQYNYIDLADEDVTFAAPSPFGYEVPHELHLATVRLNYRFGGFGGPVVARY